MVLFFYLILLTRNWSVNNDIFQNIRIFNSLPNLLMPHYCTCIDSFLWRTDTSHWIKYRFISVLSKCFTYVISKTWKCCFIKKRVTTLNCINALSDFSLHSSWSLITSHAAKTSSIGLLTGADVVTSSWSLVSSIWMSRAEIISCTMLPSVMLSEVGISR